MQKVSVIIPTFNRANYIGEAIDSVLSQTYKDYEIVVVDDGSTDNTKEVLKKYSDKIKYVYQRNRGLSASRNRGIDESNGEYIGFLDSDDIWLSDKLEKQVDILDQGHNYAFVCSDSYVIDETGKIIKTFGKGIYNYETFESLYEENFVLVLTVLLRRRCLEDVGLFDETLSMSEDYDLWLRIAKRYKFKHLSSPLSKYRTHSGNMSKKNEVLEREVKKVIDKYETTYDLSIVRKIIGKARRYYFFGTKYHNAHNFYKAGICFLKSALNFPFVGYYYWSKETENFRFSLPYRVLKIYFLICVCFMQLINEKMISRVNGKIKLSLFKILITSLLPFLIFKYFLQRKLFKNHRKIGMLNVEFFHKEIGVYGGYGMTSKYISDYFNKSKNSWEVEILLNRSMNFKKPKVKRLDETEVIFFSDLITPGLKNIWKYAQIINKRNIDLLLTVEYYSPYFYTIFLLPKTPLIFWIHDPRPLNELEKIATVNLAKLTDGVERNTISEYERRSLKRIIRLSKFLKRKIAFATTAHCLIEKAKRTYDLSDIEPFFLPIPVEVPELKEITYSSKPSICFLGRLDPIKRPWIFFELARRFKDIEFIVAGKTHFPQIMEPVIKSYSDAPNLKFLGLVYGKEKEETLKKAWCIINTSVHEALPVSFLEALSYGKPIISCHNPDELVSRFGVYTGEILGEGLDDESLNAFSEGIDAVLFKRQEWKEKGKLARNLIKELYSFQNFESIIKSYV